MMIIGWMTPHLTANIAQWSNPFFTPMDLRPAGPFNFLQTNETWRKKGEPVVFPRNKVWMKTCWTTGWENNRKQMLRTNDCDLGCDVCSGLANNHHHGYIKTAAFILRQDNCLRQLNRLCNFSVRQYKPG